MSSEIVQALEPIVSAFEAHNIAYRISGSVASSALGVPRSTLDIDIVAEIENRHVDVLVALWDKLYYVDPGTVRDAITHRTSFNLIFLATSMKVDVFVKRGGIYEREMFRRRTRMALEDGTRDFDLATAEDVILRKLEWYKLRGSVSERQWSDILGVLQVQRQSLDIGYLRTWADALDVLQSLLRAMKEAGLS